MDSPTTPSGLPLQLVVGPAQHGVTLYAGQLATALDAPVVSVPGSSLEAVDLRGASAVHLHFADRLLGASPREAARQVVDLCARVPVTLTLHDVPQAWDDPARRQAYADVVRAALGWAVNSHHEMDLAQELLDGGSPASGSGTVVHLPFVDAPADAPAALEPTGPRSLAVLGFVYPDKGHRELLRAAVELRARGEDVEVVCLGAVASGHDDLMAELRERARVSGVPLRVTGYLSDLDLHRAMAETAVAVVGHRHLSASGSMNSWLAAGRRPLVLDGSYAREMAALRPGAYLLYEDGALVDAIARSLADPTRTRLAPDAVLLPGLAAVARQYAAWWAAVHRSTPRPSRPVAPPMPAGSSG